MKEIFNNLVILDLANNHFGDVNHAKKIIKLFGKVVKTNKIKAALKFQFRDLDTFFSKTIIQSENKYIQRFLSTKLMDKNFLDLKKYAKQNKMLTSCTPFDEKSIDKIEKFKFDILKIASVSSLDFNLLERACFNNIPKVISTGGKKLSDIDKIVSFFKRKKQTFALMHCIAIYPTKNYDLNISFIKNLKKRYEDVPIGWSTHESPNEYLPASLAMACGATLFEKHIGISTKKYPLNDYSINPDQFENWVKNIRDSKEILGNYNKPFKKEEIKTLNTLQRGVFAKKNLKKNQIIKPSDVYFAFPLQKNQLSSPGLKKNTKILKNISMDEPIKQKDIKLNKDLADEYLIKSYIHSVKAILNYNNIKIGNNFDLEISHHKGIKNFKKIGCFLFNIINKNYAKKLLVMLPNQSHPLHFHKQKDESFHIISGKLISYLNNKKKILNPGDILHIKKNSWHKFQASDEGCIFDEISTTNYKNDSFYKNRKIKKLSRDDRKTYINSWI